VLIFVTVHFLEIGFFLVFRKEEYYRKIIGFTFQVKGQCKVQPRIDHEGQDRKERHSFTLSLTGTDFPHPSRSTMGPTQPAFSWSKVTLTSHFHLTPRLKKE